MEWLLLLLFLGSRRCPHCEGKDEVCSSHAARQAPQRSADVDLGWPGVLISAGVIGAAVIVLLWLGPPGCTGAPTLEIRPPFTFTSPHEVVVPLYAPAPEKPLYAPAPEESE